MRYLFIVTVAIFLWTGCATTSTPYAPLSATTTKAIESQWAQTNELKNAQIQAAHTDDKIVLQGIATPKQKYLAGSIARSVAKGNLVVNNITTKP